MSAQPTPEEYLAAAARVPAGKLSDDALARLALLAPAYPEAARLLRADAQARRALVGPLPDRNPIRPGDLLDALRRHRSNAWPRPGHADGPQYDPFFYSLISHQDFTQAVSYLAVRYDSHHATLTHLRAYHTDAPSGYEYRHPDAPALAAALSALSALLWASAQEKTDPPQEQP